LARAELSALRNRVSVLLALAQRFREVGKALEENETPRYQNSVKEIEEQLRALGEKRTRIQGNAARVEEELRRQRQGGSLLQSLAQLHEHGAHLGLRDGRCPLCNSRVSPEEFTNRLQKIRDDITNQNSALMGLVEQQTKLTAELQSCGLEIQALERQHEHLVGKPQALKQEQARVRKEIRRLLPNFPETSSTASEIESEIRVIRERAALLEKNLGLLETSKTVERVNQLRKRLEENRRHGDVIDARVSRPKIVSERFKEAASALKRVSGELVDDRLAQLSQPIIN
jgi:chromosome segregation ATPase